MLRRSVALTNNRDATECVNVIEYVVVDIVESTVEIPRPYAISKFTGEVKKSEHPQKLGTSLLHFAHTSFLSEVFCRWTGLPGSL